MENIVKPKELYEKFLSDRKSYEDRAEENSKYTVPAVFPSTSFSPTSSQEDTYGNRYCSLLVNSLAANISLALFPPSGSPFKFDPDKDAMLELTQGDSKNRAALMKQLISTTTEINQELSNQNIRNMVNPLVEYLMIVGSTVAEKIDGQGIRLHSLRNFTVQLSSTKEPLKINIMEEIDPIELPESVDYEQYADSETVELYTSCVKQRDGSWILYQSVNEEEYFLEETYKNYLELPYTYLGWEINPTDKYHRAMVERTVNIIKDYENINRVLVQGSIAASKVLLLVNPLGTTEKSDVANSANGAVIDGRQEDIGSFQLGKNYDFQVPQIEKQEIKKELDRVFMSRQGTQRDAERVTAYENSLNAQELDKDKAGIYSTLSVKFTKWLVMQIMKELKIKFEAIDVNIITGLDALGRSMESNKLDNYINRMYNFRIDNYIKKGELATRYATYEGIDIEGLLKTEDEVQAEVQAQQEAMAKQQLLESGAKSLGEQAGQGGLQQQ